jgi:hypothetical protein
VGAIKQEKGSPLPSHLLVPTGRPINNATEGLGEAPKAMQAKQAFKIKRPSPHLGTFGAISKQARKEGRTTCLILVLAPNAHDSCVLTINFPPSQTAAE